MVAHPSCPSARFASGIQATDRRCVPVKLLDSRHVTQTRGNDLRRPLHIQLQQPRQYLIIAEVGRPTIGRQDRFIESALRVVQPRQPLVVEAGQGALFDFSSGIPRCAAV